MKKSYDASRAYASKGKLEEFELKQFKFNNDKDPENNDVHLKHTTQQYHLMISIMPCHLSFRVREIQKRK